MVSPQPDHVYAQRIAGQLAAGVALALWIAFFRSKER